jgi:hypothetical protein
VATFGVALFEAEEFDFGGDEVDYVDHFEWCGGGLWMVKAVEERVTGLDERRGEQVRGSRSLQERVVGEADDGELVEEDLMGDK